MDTPDHLPGKLLSRPLFFSYVTLAALLFAVLTGALTAVIIRSVDDLLAALELTDFAVIFSALDTADLDVHGIIPTILAFLFTLSLAATVRKGRKSGKSLAFCLVFAIPAGVLLLLVSLAVSVWLTEVNDIRFGTVLLSMYDNLDALAGL